MPYRFDASVCANFERSSRLEWVLPDGRGGYAMGTLAGPNTRRYHGHLVIADPDTIERTVLFDGLDAFVEVGGVRTGLSANQYPGALFPQGHQFMEECLVGDSVVWRYRVGRAEIQKEVVRHRGEDACTVTYRNRSDERFRLVLFPLVCHKSYHEVFHERGDYPDGLEFHPHRSSIVHGGRTLHLLHPGAQRHPVQGWYYRFERARDEERGLTHREDLFCPCELRYEMAPGAAIHLVATTDPDASPRELPEPAPDHSRLGPLLAEAAAKFVIETPARTSILAGFPWFTDWGRDTMIALPGVLLHTGRTAEARRLLTDYAGQMRDGLLPNRFVESGAEPEYNTVDATLWFANAIYRTLQTEWNASFAVRAMKALDEAFEAHVQGTRFGIGVDPADGLLAQGEPGVQLTWMDAKIGDWVVTPRHGKPVEINGLWVNALRAMAWLAEKLGRPGEPYRKAAEKAEKAFDAKFWSPTLGYYLDTVDPDDASLRPNQLIAMSLPFGPATGDHARQALGVVAGELLTPFGVRTLAPSSSQYHGRFRGPLPELDAAYHQGTAWPWLLGSYTSALVKLTGDRREAKRVLREARAMLTEYGVGGLAEVYDGDAPQSPGGCPWQAWSVGEFLRAWVEDAGGD